MSNTIYIIKEAEQVRNGEDIYKIGMTRKTIQKRISQYRKGSKIIFCFECNNIECSLFESHLINEFKEFFKQRTDFGREYFEGDSLLMIEKILMDYKMLKNKKTKEKQLKNNQQSPNEPLKVPFNEEKNNPDNNFIEDDILDEFIKLKLEEKEGNYITLKQIKNLVNSDTEYRKSISCGHTLKKNLERKFNVNCILEKKIHNIKYINVFMGWGLLVQNKKEESNECIIDETIIH